MAIVEIPPEAKQTNCWKFALIFYTCVMVIDIVLSIFQGQIGVAVGYVVDLIIWYMIMMHVAYTMINVNEERIEITMGPWQWPVCSWFCSSQITKAEIVSIETKQRQCLWDVFPRFYCSPIMWCCCHKSYSAYWWPCCCNEVNCCNLCDGDSDSSHMIQINLTADPKEFASLMFKRCAPCPLPWSLFVCCVYNRISVSIKNQEVIEQIQSAGYPLSVGPSDEKSALVSQQQTNNVTEGDTDTPVPV